MNREKRRIIADGLLSQNALLVKGLAIAPAVLYANTLKNAVTLAVFIIVFSFVTLALSSFIPQSMIYTSRVILYSLIGAVVFVPMSIYMGRLIPLDFDSMGIFMPLMITNPFIVSRSEMQFFKNKGGKMFLDIFFSLLGYGIAVIIIGFIRELISTGGIGGKIFGIKPVFTGAGEVFGGFILLGLLAALTRYILMLSAKPRSDSGK